MQELLIVMMLLGFLAALVGWPTYRALTAGRPDRVRAWAAAQALPLTEENEPIVTDRLARGGRWRAVGALGGLLLGTVVGTVVGSDLDLLLLVAVVLGYMGGVLAGSVGAAPLPQGDRRRASLDTRRLVDYVPPIGLRWMYAGVVATLAATVAFLLLPRDESLVDPAESVVASLVAVAVAGTARLLSGHLVRRPQPAASAPIVASDDAIRSAGVRSAVASGTAAVMVTLSYALYALATADVAFLGVTMQLAALGCLGFAWGAWRILIDPSRWRVRRGLEPGPVA
jgi:hypothetical protein